MRGEGEERCHAEGKRKQVQCPENDPRDREPLAVLLAFGATNFRIRNEPENDRSDAGDAPEKADRPEDPDEQRKQRGRV